MRLFYTLSFFCCPLLASCKGNPEPGQILQKAIEAHGGEQNINKPRKGIIKATGKGVAEEITQEEVFDFPKQGKRITIADFQGERKKGYTLMIDGKYWEWEEGHAPRQPTQYIVNAAPDWSSLYLLNLKKDTVKLTPIGRTKVQGKSAVGFRAAWDGTGGDYYFDNNSGLLAQANVQWSKGDGKEYQLKTFYSEYKQVDGLQIAYRRLIYIKGGSFDDFVLMTDLNVTELSILDKLPDDAFALPR